MTEMSLNDLSISTEDLDLEEYREEITIDIVGLGATGSAFLLSLAHFLRNETQQHIDYHINLFDFDVIEDHNNRVSLYEFYQELTRSQPISDIREGNHKVDMSYNMLHTLTRPSIHQNLDNRLFITPVNEAVSFKSLYEYHAEGEDLPDYIIVFGDNMLVRYEIGRFHQKYPSATVIDTRIGTYNEFELIYSENPLKYMNTIYYNEDGTVKMLENNKVCLADRMSFSIAMSASSMAFNHLLTSLRRSTVFRNEDFSHFIFSNTYRGNIKD